MSEMEIRIGGRPFTVACQPGEEEFLETAARLLDAEASALVQSLGRMPEAQMLLMAGLMLADRTAGLEDRLASGTFEAAAAEMAEAAQRLEALVARAEALAEAVEARAAGA
ncbi:MAG: cell division protein ZapA [Rhodobacteraceae bacterium]|nr:cell division protein ZapA [Paracoccaceae bacterium]